MTACCTDSRARSGATILRVIRCLFVAPSPANMPATMEGNTSSSRSWQKTRMVTCPPVVLQWPSCPAKQGKLHLEGAHRKFKRHFCHGVRRSAPPEPPLPGRSSAQRAGFGGHQEQERV